MICDLWAKTKKSYSNLDPTGKGGTMYMSSYASNDLFNITRRYVELKHFGGKKFGNILFRNPDFRTMFNVSMEKISDLIEKYQVDAVKKSLGMA